MSELNAVLLGVISSLIATFFFLILSGITRKVVVPWVADMLYRGVRVDGRWTMKRAEDNESDSPKNASFELTQKADKISGIYSHQDNKGSVESYRVSGEIRNTYLTASLWPISDEKIDAGAIMLRAYSEQGAKMKGVISYINTIDGSVETADIDLRKTNS